MKKTITFFSTRAAMMLLATLLFTLTAQTAKAGAYDVLYADLTDTDNNGTLETMTLKCAASYTAADNRYQYNGNWSWTGSFKDAVTTVNIDASCAYYTGTTLSALFYGLKNVTAINGLASLRTDDVTNMNSVFSYCNKVTALDISGWDTEGVTTMESMFYECHSLTALDLSVWKTASVTTMNTMFYNCYNLATLDITGFNTASVTDMYGMFYGCNNLTTLDIASFNTANVTKMGSMFRDCPRLVSILIGPNWQATTGSKGMFYGCSSLVGDTGTKCSVTSSDTEDYTYAHWGNSGYMSAKWMNNTLYADVSSDGKTMTLKCSNHFTAADNRYQYNGWNWAESFRAPITTITVDASCANYTGTTLNGLFYRFANATVINDLDKLRTDDVTDMEDVFFYCEKVTALDGINAWNTAKVTTMLNLFCSCRAVTTLDLSGWNTATVTDMSSMFAGCDKLCSLDLSGWNTASVTTMNQMFSSCRKLTTLDLADFNTVSVTDMGRMFNMCDELQTILVGSGWTTAAVAISIKMFYSCSPSLTGGKGTKWNSSNALDATYAVVDGLNSQHGYLTGEYTLFNTGDDADHAYVIDSKVLFNLFSRRVNAGNDYQGKFLKLGDDLTYTSTTANNFTPIGTESHPFKGTFDGDGNTISGINISLGSTDYVGLFGYADGADIKSLKLTNSTITGKDKVGGITGYAGSTKIANCLVTNGVYVTGDYYAGGVSGMSGQISGCTSAANVRATSYYAGGIVGYINGQYSNSIDHCLYTGDNVTGNSKGAIVGYNTSSAPMNYNYYTADLNIGGCRGADTDGTRKAVVIDKASGVTFTPTGTTTTYDVSGITAYSGNSLVGYGGNFYAGHNESVNLDITYASPYEGFSLTGYTDGVGSPATALTYVSGNTWKLTMPATTVYITPAGQDLWGENGAGRDGSTAAKAYRITTPEGLNLLASKVNGGKTYSGMFFELGDDITYTGSSNNYTAIGTDNYHPFSGKFDGKGYTVSGIRINKAAENQGLFGYISGATVKNLTIDDATITIVDNKYNAGAIAGYAGGGSIIENCHAIASVTVSANAGGGIVGNNNYSTIRGCTSAAIVSGVRVVGAIAGNNSSSYGTIENCLVLDANVTADDDAGAIAGAIAGMNSGTLTNNRYTSGTSVNGGSPIGHGTDESGDITDNGGATVAYEFPIDIDNFADVVGTAADTYGTGDYQGITAYKLNDAYTALAYKGQLYYPSLWTGTGASDSDPYVIYTPEGLDKLASDVNGGTGYGDKYFALGHDIAYNGSENIYTPIGTSASTPFRGRFDGKGHTVSGINVNSTNDYVGLFSHFYGIYVKNLTVASSNFTGNQYVGAIAGETDSQSRIIENCVVASDVTVTASKYAGGITGQQGTIRGCISAATVSASKYAGGITAFNSLATISDCLYLGTSVTGSTSGAIVGNQPYGNVVNNYHTAYGLGGVNGNDTNGNGAQFAVSSTSKPEAITGDATATYGTGSYTGITAYANGLYYNGRYYWHEELTTIEIADRGTENHIVINDNNGQTRNVKLKDRTLYKDGKWNTIRLPFDVDLTDPACPLYGATYRTVTGASISGTTLSLTFAEKRSFTNWADNTLTAGVPYIIKWDKAADYVDDDAHNIVNPVFINVTVQNVGDDYRNDYDNPTVAFFGTYDAWTGNDFTIYADGNNNGYGKPFDVLLLGGDNKLHYAGSGASLGACRAYFLIDPAAVDPTSPKAARLTGFNINFGDGEDETTGIVSMEDGGWKMEDVNDTWYSIDGRKLDGKPTKKGLYIVNGKKVVIK